MFSLSTGFDTMTTTDRITKEIPAPDTGDPIFVIS